MSQITESIQKPKRSFGFIFMLCLIAGPFLTALSSSIINVALPDIASSYNSSLTDVQWVISGYALAMAAMLVACAFMSKRFGDSKVYFVSMIGFTLASIACALAPSLGWLIFARIVQGACGAPLVPIVMNILLNSRGEGDSVVPVEFGLILFLAPAIGPTVGGLLINWFSWPVVFLLNVPIALAAAAVLLLDREKTMSKHDIIDRNARFDIIGTLALAAGLVLTIYGSTRGPQDGWTSMSVLPLIVGGIVLILFYLGWALVKPKPAIDLKLIRNAKTALTLLVSLITVITAMSVLFLVPIIMESVQGYSVLDAGMAMLPQGIMMGIGIVVSEMIIKKGWLSVRTLVMAGILLLAVSTASMLGFEMSTPTWASALILAARGLSMGMVIQPLLTEMLITLRPEEASDGNTLFNVAQQLGASIGISAAATIFQTQAIGYVGQVLAVNHINAGPIHIGGSGSALSKLPAAMLDQINTAIFHGFHDTVLVLVGLALIGVLLSLFLKSTKKQA
ncbi:MAG TPA: DHA2 family efflux MFS transporter permease subunit [Methanocellaceae archaeon]